MYALRVYYLQYMFHMLQTLKSSRTSCFVKSLLLNSKLKFNHFQLTVDRVMSTVILSALPPISSSVK